MGEIEVLRDVLFQIVVQLTRLNEKLDSLTNYEEVIRNTKFVRVDALRIKEQK